MKFCYLKRERYGGKQKLMWLLVDVETDNELAVGGGGARRLKSDAEKLARLLGYTILPDGMTPEQYIELKRLAGIYPHWRQEVLLRWHTGADAGSPLLRQLRNNLGPKGLAKFKF